MDNGTKSSKIPAWVPRVGPFLLIVIFFALDKLTALFVIPSWMWLLLLGVSGLLGLVLLLWRWVKRAWAFIFLLARRVFRFVMKYAFWGTAAALLAGLMLWLVFWTKNRELAVIVGCIALISLFFSLAAGKRKEEVTRDTRGMDYLLMLTYLGKKADRVGQTSAQPDGEIDGTFKLEVRRPVEDKLLGLTLERLGKEKHCWSTSPSMVHGAWLLGVEREYPFQAYSRPITAWPEPVPPFQNRTYFLYASDAPGKVSYFRKGQKFRATLHLERGGWDDVICKVH